MRTGLFIGRFQPFHLGHLRTLKFALDKSEVLIIAVGSAQKSYELRNPFTAGERITMIRNSICEDRTIDYKKILIIPVMDVDIHKIWTYHLDTLVPKYDHVFSNDSFTKLLFQERGIRIIEPTLHNRNQYSGTETRGRMANDRDWEILVPKATARIITEINGIDRIKSIFSKMESDHH